MKGGKDSITVWLLSPYSYCIFHTAVQAAEKEMTEMILERGILARIVKVTFISHYHHKSGGLALLQKGTVTGFAPQEIT